MDSLFSSGALVPSIYGCLLCRVSIEPAAATGERGAWQGRLLSSATQPYDPLLTPRGFLLLWAPLESSEVVGKDLFVFRVIWGSRGCPWRPLLCLGKGVSFVGGCRLVEAGWSGSGVVVWTAAQ